MRLYTIIRVILCAISRPARKLYRHANGWGASDRTFVWLYARHILYVYFDISFPGTLL